MTDPIIESLPPAAECIEAVRAWLLDLPQQPKAYLHTFGCQLNVADGEKLAGLLTQMGYAITEEIGEASLILYNTCAVRENAEDRVFGTLGSIKHLKTENPGLILCVTGCMTAQETVAEKLRKSYPYVDIVLGSSAVQRLPTVSFSRALRTPYTTSAPASIAFK